MSSVLITIAVLLLLGGIVLLASLWRRSQSDDELAASRTADQLTAAVARHLRRTNWLAWPLAVGLAAAAAFAFDSQAVIVAPVLLILGVVLAYAIGEATAPVPERTAGRSASLEPRIPTEYLTPRRRLLWIAATVTAIIVGVTAILLADGTGRSLTVTCPAGSETVSPFPGLSYGAAGLWALLPVQVMAAVAFRRITNRPATGLASAAPADRLLRVATTLAVVRASTAASLLLTSGVGLSAGLALLQVSDGPCTPGWRVPVGWALLAIGLLAIVVLVGVAVDALRARRTSAVRLMAEQAS